MQEESRARCCAFFVLLVLSIFAIGSVARAQSNATDSAMDGYVTDASGAAIAHAHLTARNLATNVTDETTSDANGYYRFPILKIGSYAVVATADGFSVAEQSGITLSVGSQIRINLSLKTGDTSSVIEVKADASIIETSTPTMGATLNSTELRALPIVSRNIYNLYFFSPGVTGKPQSTFSSPLLGFDGITSSYWQLDGLDNTQRNGSNPFRLVITTPEVLAQTQVLANGYSAEFGRTSGGIVNAVTRGGTNAWHGSFFGFYRPSATMAVPGGASVKPSSKWQTYEGDLGGPIRKDKLFFFASMEYTTLVNPSAVTITAANAEALGIPASELGSAPVGQKFPTPSVRVDYKINPTNSAFLRWTSFSNEEPNATAGGLLPVGTGTFFHDRQQGGEAQIATILSPSMLNEFRFGDNRRDTFTTPMQPASPTDVLIKITSVATLGNSASQGTDTTEKSIEFVDNITKTVSRHTMKFGVEYENSTIRLNSATPTTYTFANLAAYQKSIGPKHANSYQQVTFALGNSVVSNNFNFFNAFAQDEFRISPRLTINYGLRYELIHFPQLDQHAPYIYSRSVNQFNRHIAPRLSAIYGLSANTVLRAAGGIYWDTPNLIVYNAVSQNNGDLLFNYTAKPTDAGAPVFPANPTTASGKVGVPNITAYDPNYRDMYAVQSNLQLEHAFTSNFSVNLQYSLLVTRHAPYSHDVNLGPVTGTLADGRPIYSGAAGHPNPDFNEIIMITSGATTNYNGIALTVNKRLSHGLSLGATYSYGHALGTTDISNSKKAIQTTPIEDSSDLHRDYGPLSSDVRHNFVVQALYSPTFRTQWLRVANGFKLSTLTYTSSGLPMNLYAGTDLNNDQQLTDRPLFASKNSYRGPAFYQVDVRAAYGYDLKQKYHLEIFAESENIANHNNADCTASIGCSSALESNVKSASFMNILSYRQPRALQFGGRIGF